MKLSHALFSLLAVPLAYSAQSSEERGKSCERQAQEFYRETYGREFLIFTNIEYSKKVKNRRDKPHNIVGELDIIVVDRRTRTLIDVGEVKCSTLAGLQRTQEKAFSQLERFAKFCFKEKSCSFWRGSGSIAFDIPWSADKVLFRVLTYIDTLDETPSADAG